MAIADRTKDIKAVEAILETTAGTRTRSDVIAGTRYLAQNEVVGSWGRSAPYRRHHQQWTALVDPSGRVVDV